MTLDVTYGSAEGPVYLNIKNNDQASTIFLNFVRSVVGYVGEDEFGDSEFARVKSALVEYNAVYRYSQSKSGYVRKHFIRFGTPKDLTAFLMRYS